jgi:hypothetical protein
MFFSDADADADADADQDIFTRIYKICRSLVQDINC